MEWVIGSVCLVALYIAIMAITLFRRKADESQNELDDFSGVLDVKREIKDKLDTDREYINKLHDNFND